MRLTQPFAAGLAVGVLALAGAGTAIACTGPGHPDNGDATAPTTTTTTTQTTPAAAVSGDTTTSTTPAATTSKRRVHRARVHHARRS